MAESIGFVCKMNEKASGIHKTDAFCIRSTQQKPYLSSEGERRKHNIFNLNATPLQHIQFHDTAQYLPLTYTSYLCKVKKKNIPRKQ